MRKYIGLLAQVQRSRASELTRYQVKELENIFVLLLLGSFTGIPSPPAFVAIELFPLLKRELKVLLSRARDSSDALAEIAALLDIA